MKYIRTLVSIVVFVVAGFGLGFAARKGPTQDNRQIVTADYEIAGATNSPTEQTFPKNWGRLVNYVVDEVQIESFLCSKLKMERSGR